MYSDKWHFFHNWVVAPTRKKKGCFLCQFSFLSYRSENWDVHEKIRGTFYFISQKEMETFFGGVEDEGS
jgi:hypothetical protein